MPLFKMSTPFTRFLGDFYKLRRIKRNKERSEKEGRRIKQITKAGIEIIISESIFNF
jgi:hypothetical protein